MKQCEEGNDPGGTVCTVAVALEASGIKKLCTFNVKRRRNVLDFLRLERCPEGEARRTSEGLNEISRSHGVYNPIHIAQGSVYIHVQPSIHL